MRGRQQKKHILEETQDLFLLKDLMSMVLSGDFQGPVYWLCSG